MRDRSTGTAAAPSSSMAISAYSVRLQSRRSTRSKYLGSISSNPHRKHLEKLEKRATDVGQIHCQTAGLATLEPNWPGLAWPGRIGTGRDGLPYLATS